MIPNAAEIASGLYGAWRLARLDRAGMTFFDPSLDGFWKSFFAAVLVAPGYALWRMIDVTMTEVSGGPVRILLVESLVYVMIWIAYPLVMFHLTQNIGRAQHYLGFIVAYNWAQVIVLLVVLPVEAILASEILPGPLVFIVSLGAPVLVLGYQWFIARAALDISGLAAAGVIALAVFLELVIDMFGLGMIR